MKLRNSFADWKIPDISGKVMAFVFVSQIQREDHASPRGESRTNTVDKIPDVWANHYASYVRCTYA